MVVSLSYTRLYLTIKVRRVLLREIHSHVESFESRRVVVTGLGTVTPLGTDTKSAFDRLLKGHSSSRSITEESNEEDEKFKEIYSRLSSQVACRLSLKEFNEKRNAYINKTDLRTMSRAMSMGIIASDDALKDAKWTPNDDKLLNRTGVAIGNAMVDLDYITDSHNLLTGNAKSNKVSPFFVPRILPNLCSGHVSIKHGFKGPCHSVSTACATGSHAIGDSLNFIKSGVADVMVAGGCDACINPLSVAAFCRARALSTKYNDNPAKASRPFDVNRDGFVMGEGSGVIVLEELQHALKRNARIYCELLGYGLSGDSYHITSGREDGEGALLAMKNAFRNLRNISSEHNKNESAIDERKDYELWCINAHATSTPKGDAAEMTAVNKFLSDLESNTSDKITFPKEGVHVTSHKGNFGHLMGAAGSVESAFAVLSLSKRILPPTINLENAGDLEVNGKTRIVRDVIDDSHCKSTSKKLILKNSFGFGGTNVSLLFGEYLS